MPRKLLVVLLNLFLIHGYAQKGVLLSGKITGPRPENIQLLVYPPFSLHTLNGAETYAVPVDNKGYFSFRTSHANADLYIYAVRDEEPWLQLYLSGSDLSVQWNSANLLQSFKVVNDKDSLNKVSVRLQQLFRSRIDSLRNQENDFGILVSKVNKVNEEGFDLLKKYRPLLDSASYHKLAYDFYYENLEVIINANNYSPLYYDNLTGGRFPYITCYDYKYEQCYKSRRKEAERMTFDPPQSIAFMNSMKESSAVKLAKHKYSSEFKIADENALQASLHYRRFLAFYIDKVTTPFKGFPYPSIDNTSLNNTENFYHFIQSTISQDKIADWLLSQRWLSLAGNQREYADSADFVKLYTLMHDDEIKQWFANGYKAILKFQAGDKAPDFTLQDEYGKPCSLSQFKGKAIFITFWSSSCAPCIAEIKACNKTVTEKYKNDAVVFVNISLDENTEKWKSAIKKYTIKGVNLMVRNGWADEVVKKYKVGAIPCHIAIDKQAIIRSYNDIRLCDIFTAQEFTKIIMLQSGE